MGNFADRAAALADASISAARRAAPHRRQPARHDEVAEMGPSRNPLEQRTRNYTFIVTMADASEPIDIPRGARPARVSAGSSTYLYRPNAGRSALDTAAANRRMLTPRPEEESVLRPAEFPLPAGRGAAIGSSARIAAIDDRLHQDTHVDNVRWSFLLGRRREVAAALLAAVEAVGEGRVRARV